MQIVRAFIMRLIGVYLMAMHIVDTIMACTRIASRLKTGELIFEAVIAEKLIDSLENKHA